MDVVIGDLLTIEGKKYITLEVLDYEGSNYVFTNLMTDDEETTEDFYIFRVINNEVEMVLEEKLKNILISKFQELLENDLKKIIDE